MANPFFNFLAGGLQGYNTGRQQATVNDQQQQQIDEQMQARRIADRYRQQALAEQIRAAMTGEGLQQQSITNQNVQGMGNLEVNRGNLRLQNQQFDFDTNTRFPWQQATDTRDFGLRELLGRGGLQNQRVNTFLGAIPTLNESGYTPEAAGSILQGIAPDGVTLPPTLPPSPGIVAKNKLTNAQTGNIISETSKNVAEASAIPLRYKAVIEKQRQEDAYRRMQYALDKYKAEQDVALGNRRVGLDERTLETGNQKFDITNALKLYEFGTGRIDKITDSIGTLQKNYLESQEILDSGKYPDSPDVPQDLRGADLGPGGKKFYQNKQHYALYQMSELGARAATGANVPLAAKKPKSTTFTTPDGLTVEVHK